MRPILLALALCAAPAFAQTSPLTGTWKIDTSTAKFPDKPETWEVRDGTYTCGTCNPPVRVAADGAFHKVPGQSYYDELMVDASAPDRLRYAFRRQGKEVGAATYTVSPDGATLSTASRNTNNGAGTPVESSGTMTRVGAAPAGLHPVSGSWRMNRAVTSDAAVTMTFAVNGRTVKVTTPIGEGYTAVAGGPFVRNQGDPGGTMYAVKLPAPNVLEETARRAGRTVGVARYEVAADGRTMTTTYTDKRDNSVTTATATRQ